MSVQRTRLQYVFIDVYRCGTTISVALSGSTGVLRGISISSNRVRTPDVNLAGNAAQIVLKGVTGSNDYSLSKMALLEEVLKLGFKPTSNISDDFLILSREVDMQ